MKVPLQHNTPGLNVNNKFALLSARNFVKAIDILDKSASFRIYSFTSVLKINYRTYFWYHQKFLSSILRLSLYNIFKATIIIVQFADDIFIFACSPKPIKVVNAIEKHLVDLTNHYESWDTKIN